MDAADYLRFRPLYQPLPAGHLAGNFGKNLIGVDLAELAAVAADLLSSRTAGAAWRSSRLPRWARRTGTPSRPRGSGFSASPPPRKPSAMYVLSPFVRAK